MTTFAVRREKRTARMSIGAHLVELRKRVVRSAAAIVVGSVIGWFLSDLVLAAMRAPIEEVARSQHRLAALNFDTLTSAFDLKIQIAIALGIVATCPIWLYQIWAFLVPALSRKELRYGLGFFLTAVPLFLAGCAAGLFLVPHMVSLLTSFAPGQSTTLLRASDYFSFVLKLALAVGIAFVLPVFLVLFNFIGLLAGRTILRSWRIAIVAIMVFSALATPSADVISMFLLAIPMVVLYFGAASISIVHDRRVERSAERRSLDFAA